ncbi:MAG: Rdx family protein [Polyangiaceae bacterium]|nr:Rdx family protein [Polyangiaceae bacterium]
MRDAVGEEVTLTAGGTGQFDVEVDGQLVFSKAKAGRFPEHFEVIEKIPPPR